MKVICTSSVSGSRITTVGPPTLSIHNEIQPTSHQWQKRKMWGQKNASPEFSIEFHLFIAVSFHKLKKTRKLGDLARFHGKNIKRCFLGRGTGGGGDAHGAELATGLMYGRRILFQGEQNNDNEHARSP